MAQYSDLAQTIVRAIGGKENVSQALHCQTRLRFHLVDEKLAASDEELAAIDGVLQVVHGSGQLQLVIGPHVAEVFAEVEQLLDARAMQGEQVEGKHANPVERVIDFVAGTFQPIIPALSGAGMVKAVMALLVVFNLISTESQTYYMLNVFADGVFYFLPVLLAFTEAQKLKCNPILAAGVAAMMLHPNWSNYVAAGDPVNFFGVIPFTLASYGSSVIPIILVVFVQSFVEKFLNRHVPKAVNLVFVPMLTFLVMGVLAFSVLGPLGSIVGGWLATFFTFLSENAAWAPAMLIGGLLPVMVMFGIHNGIAPLGVMQMSQLGYDSIFGPGCFVSNMCQATAGLVVFLRSRDSHTREIAGSGAITAYMGITEPILYGVNLPKKYPLVAAMIGGAAGGLYAGLTQTHRFATGSSGLPAVLLYIGDNSLTCLINIVIAMLIGIVVTAVVTFVLFSKFEDAPKGGKDVASVKQGRSSAGVSLDEEKIVTDADAACVAPVAGQVIDLAQADDPVFAAGTMGAGVAINPSGSAIVAPVTGSVAAVFPTKHALGFVSDDGVEVMVHIGIDTVSLQGAPFELSIKAGDRVKRGERVGSFNRTMIEEAGLSAQTMVVISNSSVCEDVASVAHGTVCAGSALIEVK